MLLLTHVLCEYHWAFTNRSTCHPFNLVSEFERICIIKISKSYFKINSGQLYTPGKKIMWSSDTHTWMQSLHYLQVPLSRDRKVKVLSHVPHNVPTGLKQHRPAYDWNVHQQSQCICHRWMSLFSCLGALYLSAGDTLNNFFYLIRSSNCERPHTWRQKNPRFSSFCS